VLYEELAAKPDTLLLLAFSGAAAVGYGLGHVLAIDETWIPHTWVTGARIGEIESLSVLPQYRGSGLGSQLLDRLEQHLSRRGYQPTWPYLSRFLGRNTAAKPSRPRSATMGS
jgi:ribosomal protein S18 acetylase RimI-like enzyme